MKRAQKVLAILGGLAALFVGGSWLWVKSVEPRQWRQMEERVAALSVALDIPRVPRALPRETPITGNAWEHYSQAFKLVVNPDDLKAIRAVAYRMKEADFEQARRALENYGPAVEALRRGARRTEIRRARAHESEELFLFGSEGTPLSQASNVSALAIARARLLAEDGKVSEATNLYLDVAGFAEDIQGDGSTIAEMLGLSFLRTPLDELRRMVVQGKLSGDDLRLLEDGLVQLDISFPGRERTLQGNLEWFGKLILSDRLIPALTRTKPLPVEFQPGWRQAWSQRLQLTTAFSHATAAVSRVSSSSGLPFPEDSARWKLMIQELKTVRNPYADIFAAMISDARHCRAMLAELRLVRAAVHYAATGERLDLDDPFGTKLLYKLDGDRLRIWSIGKNGKDDGGKGEWNSVAEDIVLEIPLRP